jgi:RNA polymerase sigma-70 factor (ECF subfamily)
MTDSDAALVARARQGDAAAADLLLRRWFRASYLIALARLGNRADAEDACQDAFVRCLDRLHQCREPERFGPWLLQIVRSTAHNRADYLRVRATVPLEPDTVADPGRADQAAERGELRARLRAALEQLSPIQREVVLLHDLEGWLHAEIAERLELSVAMSRRHLSDARRQLRGILGDYASLEPDHD